MYREDFENIVIGQTVYMRIIDDRNNVSISKGILTNFEGIEYRDLTASFDINEHGNKYHFNNVSFDEIVIKAEWECFKFELYFDLFEYVKHAELRMLKAQELENKIKSFFRSEASMLSSK